MSKIKTALLAYGMSGKVFHAPFLNAHPGFEMLGAWERNQKNIEKDYSYSKSYNSLEEILESDAELVIVNTPTATHYEYAKRVLSAGKHALVEKAFTTTVVEAKKLQHIAVKKGVKLIVFQNRRWDSDFKTVKNILEQNLLGDIVEAEFRFERYNPNLSAKGHKETLNSGSGILKDLGPHIIDQALCLFGMPEAVFADIRTVRNLAVVDDWFSIILYYSSCNILLKSGCFTREAVPSYIIQGKKGSFLKARGDVQEEDLKAGKIPNTGLWGIEPFELQGILHTEFQGKIIKEKIKTLPGNYYDFFEDLHQCIRYNAPEPITAQDGINVIEVITAAIKSNKQQKKIVLT